MICDRVFISPFEVVPAGFRRCTPCVMEITTESKSGGIGR